MPGPGVELVGEDELAEIKEVLESGYLARYGPEGGVPRQGPALRAGGGPAGRCQVCPWG